jgi:hypothetical protein
MSVGLCLVNANGHVKTEFQNRKLSKLWDTNKYCYKNRPSEVLEGLGQR